MSDRVFRPCCTVCECVFLFCLVFAEAFSPNAPPRCRDVWQMKRRLRPRGYGVTQQPCEVVAVTSTSRCTPAGRGTTVQTDYRVAPLAPVFLTPRMKEWQHLWDKPVLDEMDLHKTEWVAYLSRNGEGCSEGKLGQGFSIGNLNLNMRVVPMQRSIDLQILFIIFICVSVLIIVFVCAHACLLLATESYLSESYQPWLKLHPLSVWLTAQAKFKHHAPDHHQNTAAAAWENKHLWVTQQDLEKS